MREGKLTDGFEIKPAIQKSINGVFFRPGRLPNPQEKSEVLTAKEIGGPAWNKVTLYERSDEWAKLAVLVALQKPFMLYYIFTVNSIKENSIMKMLLVLLFSFSNLLVIALK